MGIYMFAHQIVSFFSFFLCVARCYRDMASAKYDSVLGIVGDLGQLTSTNFTSLVTNISRKLVEFKSGR